MLQEARDVDYHVVAVSCSMQEGDVRAPVRGVYQGGSPRAPSRVWQMHVGSLCRACHYMYIGDEAVQWGETSPACHVHMRAWQLQDVVAIAGAGHCCSALTCGGAYQE